MTERTNWAVILVAYAVGVTGALQVGRIAPAGEALTAELDLTLATLGWAVSLITLASAGLGLAAGHLVVRRGARRILIAGTFVLAMGTLLAAMASSVPLLMLVRILEGVGYLGIVVAAPTLIARVATPGDAPAALALWGTFFTAGLSLAATGGGWASQTYGWRGWFGMNAALLTLVAALIFAAVPKDAHVAATSDTEGLRLPRAAWLLGAAFFGVTLLSLALLSMLPPFLIEVRAFSPVEAGGATGLVALASIVGSLAYGMLAGRIGSRPLVLAAVVALIGTAIPAFHAGLSSPAGIGFATLAVSGTGMLVAHVFASVPRLIGDPAMIGPANGLIAQIGSIGALTGPPLVGYLVSTHGWMAFSTLVAVFSVSFTVFMATAERAAAESAVA